MARRDRTQTISVLQAALSSGKVPSNLSRNAERVLHYLQKKPRISVLWYSATDPSLVVNKLLGDGKLPIGLQLPPTRFRYGDAEKTVIQLSDGSKAEFPGADPQDVLHHSPVFITIFSPSVGLQHFDLMLMKVPSDAATGSRAVQWAAGETDIAIWGTDQYTSVEDDIWANIPEHIQDHSYLTFMPFRDGSYSPVFNEIAADQDRVFHEVSRIEFDENGNIYHGDLFKVLSKDLTSATGIVLDQAEILISSLEKLEIIEKPKSDDAPAAERPTKPAQNVLRTIEESVDTESSSDPADTEATVDPIVSNEPPTKSPVQEKPATAAPKLDGEDLRKIENCITKIQDFSRKAIIELDNGNSTDELLNDIGDIFFNLNDIANDLRPDSPVKSQLVNTSGEAADLTQLLQIENSADATIEAIDLLQQTKFDLELILLAA